MAGTENALSAFIMTTVAGLATCIGSGIAVLKRQPSPKVLVWGLGMSAGVMLFAALVELYNEAETILQAEVSHVAAKWIALGTFFGSLALASVLDRLFDKGTNPHHLPHQTPQIDAEMGKHVRVPPSESSTTSGALQELSEAQKARLYRVGIMTAIGMVCHNFAEGIGTFFAALADPVKLGLPVALAVGLHNIGEGIAVSLPICAATGSKKRAFWVGFLSGFSEPVAALLAWLVLAPFMNNIILGIVIAVAAGTLVYVALDELFPAAREADDPHGHNAIYGVILGFLLMGASLALLESI